MGRTECDHDPGFAGQSVHDQVPVGRQRVETGLRVDRRSDRRGEMTGQERLHACEGGLVPGECTSVRIDRISPAVLGGLRARLAVGREAVEARFVHPDPDREPIGCEGRGIRAGEVGHLLLGDGQRQAAVERGEELVRPGVGGEDDPARAVGRRRASRPRGRRHPRRGSPVTGVRSRSVAPWAMASRRCAALPLNGSARPPRACHIPVTAVVDVPLRPAVADLGCIEEIERDVLGGEAVGVVRLGDGWIRRPQVEPAGRRHDPLARLGLDLRPRLVGALGEADVVGPVVGQPDDPGVVGRRAVEVVHLEALETEDAGAERPAQPVGRARPDRAEADDDGVPVAAGRLHGSDATAGRRRPCAMDAPRGTAHAVCYGVRMNVRTNLMLPEGSRRRGR